ncbi:MAG: FAD-binding oxidoreductase [Betaproteobacteria bacterium]|nr:FAD-binding oxidoreductase [Betaproteobacteria bacterium]
MDGYADRRDRLVMAIRNAGAGKVGLAKDTSNLFRDRGGRDKRLLDVREFDHVLAADAANGWIEAEGMATYERLVARALEDGVMPAVVPQLKTITLGGAAAGVGIEASSFKYGLVHESLLELEILTGDGRALLCRPDNEYRDLFYGFPNSYGTLGYALRLRARAVPVKPFVELTHRRFTQAGALFDALAEACAGDADFIDGVAFGPGELYLNVCRFVEAAPHTSDYTFEHIYYRSIREKELDFLTAHDFIWRWDTDWFWCSKNVGAQVPWVRRLYGRKRLGSRTYQRIMRWNSRRGLTRTLDRIRGIYGEPVIQDVDIPLENAGRFLAFFEREIGIAPVWICPIIAPADAGEFLLYPLHPGRLYVNFGFWDIIRRRERFDPGHFNRMIETKVAALRGIKSLYSDSYYSRETFREIYGGDAYRALKARYDPDRVFPDLYEKCVLRR